MTVQAAGEPPGSAPVRERGPAAAVLVCWLTALLTSSFVFSAWAHSQLPVTRSYVSELEIAGQPHDMLFRLADVLSGVGLVVAAFLVRPLARGRSAAWIGCVMLAVAGLASLADAAHPMTCAPSIDAVCRAEQDTTTGLLHQVTEPHTTSSLVGFIAIAGAMVFLGLVAAPAAHDAFRRFTIVCLVATGLTGIADVALILTHGAVGLSERARILAFALWLCGLGLGCLPPARWSGPRRRRRDRQPTDEIRTVG